MRFGIYAPTSDPYDVAALTELAQDAERCGWDGVFVWDNLIATFDGTGIVADTTVTLAAIAVATTRVRFGAIVTPLARRRPWKFAKEAATLDRLSQGRLVVGVGLGGEGDFLPFGEDAPLGARARMLDEALEAIAALWTGETVSHAGEHFSLHSAFIRPSPLQTPRVPIWVAGYWPGASPFRRAARWDGVAPVRAGELFAGLTVEELSSCVRYVKQHRSSTEPFDVVHFQTKPNHSPQAVRAYERAGATWWFESTVPTEEDIDAFKKRVEAGPPAS